jgi:hypothetical protein
MTKTPTKSKSEPELRPDGWERFEKAVDAAIKSGPKHRETSKKAPPKKSQAAQKGKDAS